MNTNPGGEEKLNIYAGERAKEYALISKNRKAELEQLADGIKNKKDAGEPVNLIFICTHNSRRSHMCHLWAQFAAYYYGVDGIFCFSGGTEATAFNSRAVKALRDSGMKIERLSDSDNPIYAVQYKEGMEHINVFSKKYSDPPNPGSDFFAVMTCSDADEACPVVVGAFARYAIPYKDPKQSDGSPAELTRYAERCRQIAREMLFLFSGM